LIGAGSMTGGRRGLCDFTTLTFDVVGTLIDFETGMLSWLAPHLRGRGLALSDREILEAFARAEAALQRDRPTWPFTRMLPAAYRIMAEGWGLAPDDRAGDEFRASIADWPAFADSIEALGDLKGHYRLVAVTNADNWALAAMSRTLGAPFALTLTAEDVGLNKPSPKVFERLLEILAPLGVRKTDVLHVAQSQYHDIVPAQALGFATAWINRRHAAAGWGATPPPEAQATPDFLATSLADLVALHRSEMELTHRT
jgi:putative hydrolase of the HAD superfamily